MNIRKLNYTSAKFFQQSLSFCLSPTMYYIYCFQSSIPATCLMFVIFFMMPLTNVCISFFIPTLLNPFLSFIHLSRSWLKEKAPKLLLAAPPRPALTFHCKVCTYTHSKVTYTEVSCSASPAFIPCPPAFTQL